MKCVYLNETNTIIKDNEKTNAIITAICIDADVRPAFKENIVKIVSQYNGEENKNMTLKWSNITEENTITYLSILKFFNVVKNITLHVRILPNFSKEMIYPAYIDIIKDIKEIYQDDIRVFIPAKKNGRRNMSYLNELLKEEDIECSINQNPLDESKFYQLANIAGGLIQYYSDPCGYFEHMDEPGKSQIVNYALSMKKSKDKIFIKK